MPPPASADGAASAEVAAKRSRSRSRSPLRTTPSVITVDSQIDTCTQTLHSDDASQNSADDTRCRVATFHSDTSQNAGDTPRLYRAAAALGCEPGRVITQVYDLQQSVGEGGFGVVLRAVHTETGVRRAVKKAAIADAKKVNTLAREAEVMRRVGAHPSIVQIQDCFVDTDFVYIVIELCFGVDLFDWIMEQACRMPPETEVSCLVRQMAQSLHHCHTRGVIHMDVKSENFVFATSSGTNHLKLIDFGLAEQMDKLTNRYSGTHGYVAPEVSAKAPKTPSLDVWALGITFFTTLTAGVMPRLADNHRLGPRSSAILRQCSAEARDLCERLLIPDPKARISLPSVLEHPFVSGTAEATGRVGKLAFLPPDRQVTTLCRLFQLALKHDPPLKPVAISKGEILLQRSGGLSSAYCLLFGDVEVRDDSGRELGVVHKGQVVARADLTGDFATLIAKTDITVLPLPEDVRLGLSGADADASASEVSHSLPRGALVSTLCNLLASVLGQLPPPRPRDLSEGAVLIKKGDTAEEAYLLLSGGLAVIDELGTRVAGVGPGAIVGETAALFGGMRTATVVAESPSVVLTLMGTALASLSADKSGLMLMREVSDKRDFRLRTVRFLRGCELFVKCCDDLQPLHVVAEALQPRRVQAGTAVVKEGAPGDEMFVLRQGTARVVAAGGHVASLRPGEVFGEMALLDDQPRSATVVAVTDCELLALGRRDFDAVFQRFPAELERLRAIAAAHRSGLQDCTAARDLNDKLRSGSQL